MPFPPALEGVCSRRRVQSRFIGTDGVEEGVPVVILSHAMSEVEWQANESTNKLILLLPPSRKGRGTQGDGSTC